MEKMTKREMFEALSEMASNDMMVFPETLDVDAIIDFCQNEIALLDKKAAKAKEAAAKRRAASDELMDVVYESLTNEFEPIAEIAARIDDEDATVSKITYRLTSLVKQGKAEKQELTIPKTETSKARKVQGYRLASATNELDNLESVED